MNESLQTKYDHLPANIKEVITSGHVPTKIKAIGEKYALHVDQLGILEDEIAAVMIGLTHPNDFVDRIEQRLDIPTEKAIGIATDVNTDIFLNIRESLMGLHPQEEEPIQPAKPPEAEATSKDQLLAEIENPKPVNQPISVTAPTAKDFITAKLTETIVTPTQKVTVGQPEKPKYSTDPYREPVA